MPLHNKPPMKSVLSIEMSHLILSQGFGLACPDSMVWLEGRWLMFPLEWEGKGAVMKCRRHTALGLMQPHTTSFMRSKLILHAAQGWWAGVDKLLWCAIIQWCDYWLFPTLSNRWGKSTTVEWMPNSSPYRLVGVLNVFASLTVNEPHLGLRSWGNEEQLWYHLRSDWLLMFFNRESMTVVKTVT